LTKGFPLWLRLLILFTVIPLLEVLIFIEMGARLGSWSVIALILLTGIIGAWLARQEGLRVLYSIKQDLDQGRLPGAQMVEAALILAGGLLLLTPGFFTDLIGFSLLLPRTRGAMGRYLISYFKARLEPGSPLVDQE
jgi:UPF0716 protein FxsA